MPRCNEDEDGNQHAEPAEELQAEEITVLSLYDSAGNRAARQSTKALDRKRRTCPDANLPDIRNLRDDGWGQRDEAARGKAEDDEEDDNGGVILARDPQRQAEEGADESDNDHGVVTPEFVGCDARKDTAEDARGY
jgi:hypothetical protein